MYSSREGIREYLLENFDELSKAYDEEFAISEFSDQFVPVYNNEILKDWIELPTEHSDKWKELGYDANRNPGGILMLMKMDLIFYYMEITQELWQEIKKEKQNEAVIG
jgi:hypothetical protein